ncbi:MAG: anaerobic ribonucleoside-triphosphate reductase activating protein [Bacillota bacterium]|nr:anaerobic ribonucleoside-triphosphate reductase activating protein [Bacillota bacterium]
MLIRLAAPCTQDSIVDGAGLRMVVWCQGCLHNCPGCHNPDTHNPKGGFPTTVSEIIQQFKANPLLSGITLSGGDPFVQAKACAEIAKAVKALGKNVWTYTGYTYEQILASGRADWQELLSYTDVLVDGPYVEELRNLELDFRGSENQRLINIKHVYSSYPAMEAG